MRRFFVTGGTGFIGREVVKKIKTLGTCYILTRHPKENTENLIYLQGDIQDTSFLRQVLQEIRPTDLVHLAWDVKAADFASSPVNAQWAKWSTELVHIFLESGGKTVIASGTCFEYDWSSNRFLTEETPCWPATFYGMAKLLTYERLSALCDKYKARFVWGRIFYPYGPGEEKRKFISNVIKTLKRKQNFSCNTPKNEIDYIHVLDVAGLFFLFAKNPKLAGVFNVCSGQGTQIQLILQLIEKQLQTQGHLMLEEQKKVNRIIGCNHKVLQAGYQLQYDIKRGIKSYFEEE